VGLAVLGIGTVAAIGGASAAHAQSISPLLNAYRTSAGSAEQVAISGSGFTPGGGVTIEILDRTSGAVLATTSLQATASTAQSWYASGTQLVCTPITVLPLQGAYSAVTGSDKQVTIGGAGLPPGGSVTKVAGGSWDNQPPSCAGGMPCYLPSLGMGGMLGNQPPPDADGKARVLQCHTEFVSVPQTAYVGGGDIATTVDVASTDSLTVEAIDTATGTVTSQVAL
jgi:hypothetical protein